MTTLKGIDVSEYQGNVDWNSVHRKYGAFFAMAKATQGDYEKDNTFALNWGRIKWRGIHRGAYHYYDFRVDPILQADFLHGFVRDSGRFVAGDFICLDVEDTFGRSDKTAMQHELALFIERCNVQIDKPVFTYSYYDFLQNQIGPIVHPTILKTPLWIASYGAEPQCPSGWNVVSFWQNSDSSIVPGVPGRCDTDLFFGDREQLKKLLRIA